MAETNANRRNVHFVWRENIGDDACVFSHFPSPLWVPFITANHWGFHFGRTSGFPQIVVSARKDEEASPQNLVTH